VTHRDVVVITVSSSLLRLLEDEDDEEDVEAEERVSAQDLSESSLMDATSQQSVHSIRRAGLALIFA
jgi:hypothetical protein